MRRKVQGAIMLAVVLGGLWALPAPAMEDIAAVKEKLAAVQKEIDHLQIAAKKALHEGAQEKAESYQAEIKALTEKAAVLRAQIQGLYHAGICLAPLRSGGGGCHGA